MRHSLLIPMVTLSACTLSPARQESKIDFDSLTISVSNLEPILDSSYTAEPYLTSGIQPYRRGLRRIREDHASVLEVSRGVVYDKVLAADVVIIADVHQYEVIQIALLRAIEMFTTEEQRMTGRFSVGLEAIPIHAEAEVARLRSSNDSTSLQRLLSSCWSWPIQHYMDVLLHPKQQNVHVLCLGQRQSGDLRVRNTPFRKEVPVPPSPVPSLWDAKYGTRFYQQDIQATQRISDWIRASRPHGKVFVLFGAAHVLDNDADIRIAGRLRKIGLRVVVLVPFMREWELALRQRFGTSSINMWYEVLPDVFRSPLVTEAELSDMVTKGK